MLLELPRLGTSLFPAIIIIIIIIVVIIIIISRDSSVGIATGYGLDDQGEQELDSR
jgi:preprotein translocase subunit SecG